MYPFLPFVGTGMFSVYFKYIFHPNIKLFETLKSDQDPDPD